jgi:glycosyltransferase involved in cell wall biosynthesis
VVDVSVIIPARDAEETLVAQLDALANQDYSGDLEIIIADNGSRDATAAIVKQRQSSLHHLRLVDVSVAEGACAARNVGAQHALGPALLFCDADDIVGESWCDALTSALVQYDAVGGAIDFSDLSPHHETDVRLMHELDRWPDFEPFAWSCNFGIRKEVFEGLGGFDESFAGCEDEALCWLLHRRGHSLGFAPRAIVSYRMPPVDKRLGKTFRYATDEPHLYRDNRAAGMPAGPPIRRWLGRLAREAARCVRRPTSSAVRATFLHSTARFFGSVVGSIKHRTWYLPSR